MEKNKRREYIRYGAAVSRIGQSNIYFSYTREELNSVRYYQGDTDAIALTEEKQDLIDFYQVSNAYEVLNTLLFPGITNEQARIVNEHRDLSQLILDHMDQVLNIYENMASVFYKYTCNANRREVIYSNRFDRENSLQFLKEGKNCCFMSTKLCVDLEYFRKKSGLLLEKIEALPHILYLDVNEVLGAKGKFSSEREILFPPFCTVELEEEKLTAEEFEYKDINGNPPVAKYRVRIMDNDETTYSTWDRKQIRERLNLLKMKIVDKSRIENAKKVWDALKAEEALCQDEQKMYESWKSFIQEYVKLIFAQAGALDKKKDSLLMRYHMFCNELQDCIEKNNEKREKTQRRVERSSIANTTFSALVSFLLALSFVDNDSFQLAVKIAGLAFSCLSLVLVGICKAKAWEGKFQQRSVVFLKLDQLQRDLRYESSMDEDKLNEYIQRFKDILAMDMMYCETNVQSIVTHLDEAASENVFEK